MRRKAKQHDATKGGSQLNCCITSGIKNFWQVSSRGYRRILRAWPLNDRLSGDVPEVLSGPDRPARGGHTFGVGASTRQNARPDGVRGTHRSFSVTASFGTALRQMLHDQAKAASVRAADRALEMLQGCSAAPTSEHAPSGGDPVAAQRYDVWGANVRGLARVGL